MYYIIKLNGLYDILCALAILDITPFILRTPLDVLIIPILRKLHTSMFLSIYYSESIVHRFFAYWIFTYGVIRLYSSDSTLIAYTYYIEAFAIANECFVKKTMHINKSVFVIFSSILLGFLCETCYKE